MSLIPWRQKREPGTEEGGGELLLSRLRDEIDSLFERFFGEAWGSRHLESLAGRLGMAPRIDLAESQDHIIARAELPGVDPKDLEVTVSGDILTVRGEKRREEEVEQGGYRHAERQFGTFRRSLQLPSTADPSQIDATFKDGVLTVTLAKKPEAKARRIVVKRG